MSDKRPIVITGILAISAIVVGAAWVVTAPRRAELLASNAANGSGTRGSGTRNGGEGSGTRIVGLPTDTILLTAAKDAEVEGAVICGSCRFGLDQPCNVMIWNQDAKHLYTVLPNAQLAELEALIPEECS